MPVSIYDIARELSLSAMTVSRVLNQPERASVAAATRERVLKAAQEMGYRPNRNARALVSRRTNTIALWIDHVHSSVYAQIVDACREEIQRAELEVNICEMGWHFSRPDQRRFDWQVDGVIAVDPPSTQDLASYLDDPTHLAVPRVNIGSSVSVGWEGDSVRVDLQEGTKAAVEHLIGSGCRRILYSVPAGINRPGWGNYDAYTETVLGAGLTPEYLAHEDLRMPTVRRHTAKYIQTHGRPDGIFCQFDELAIAGFRALRDLNLRVPEDVLIIGCEGNEFMDYFDPPLSTIAMPIKEMCHTAWGLLRRRIAEPNTPSETILLPYEFPQPPVLAIVYCLTFPEAISVSGCLGRIAAVTTNITPQTTINQSPQRTYGVIVVRDCTGAQTTAARSCPASVSTFPAGSTICEIPVAALRTR